MEAGGQLLVLRREGQALLRGLSHGAVIDLVPGSFEDVQQQLARAAVDCEPVIRVELLQADIAERQRAMPAFLGHGIAAPHAFVRGLNRRIVVLGRLPDGVTVPDQDEPVTLVFLIVSPSGDPEGHLATLADVAHLCASPSNRDSLLTAFAKEDVLTIVSSVLE
jgi:mannitol/fructose-specific phosphotransferase system IIA component (Ntr-type)